MHNPDPISTYYVNEAQRFDKDFAVADKQKRGQELGRWEIKIDHLRKERLQRENTRWDHIETNNQKDDKRLHVRKELYMPTKRIREAHLTILLVLRTRIRKKARN